MNIEPQAQAIRVTAMSVWLKNLSPGEIQRPTFKSKQFLYYHNLF